MVVGPSMVFLQAGILLYDYPGYALAMSVGIEERVPTSAEV